MNFIGLSTADLKAPWLGHGAQCVKNYFAQARTSAPSIIFIDEIDTLTCDRSAGHIDSIATEVTGQLLNELDGISSPSSAVFTIAATNVIDKVDSALKSRLGDPIEIPLPDIECRKKMFTTFLNNAPVDFDIHQQSIYFAKHTEGKSGRDIKDIIDQVKRKAAIRGIKSQSKIKAPILISDFSDLFNIELFSDYASK